MGPSTRRGRASASKARVRSPRLIRKVPIRQARRIALDRSSRSTQALTKILAAQRWQIAPEFVQADPDPAAMLADADAALVIGDVALHIAIAAEAHVTPGPDGEWLTAAAALADSLVAAQYIAPAKRLREASPIVLAAASRAVRQLHIYDVVKEWWHLTEKPAVLALWAARNEVLTAHPELAQDFLASRDFGLTQIPQIAAQAAPQMRLH